MAWGVPKIGTRVEDPASGGNFTLIEPAGVAQIWNKTSTTWETLESNKVVFRVYQ